MAALLNTYKNALELALLKTIWTTIIPRSFPLDLYTPKKITLEPYDPDKNARLHASQSVP